MPAWPRIPPTEGLWLLISLGQEIHGRSGRRREEGEALRWIPWTPRSSMVTRTQGRDVDDPDRSEFRECDGCPGVGDLEGEDVYIRRQGGILVWVSRIDDVLLNQGRSFARRMPSFALDIAGHRGRISDTVEPGWAIHVLIFPDPLRHSVDAPGVQAAGLRVW
jgi:hypothetical protein